MLEVSNHRRERSRDKNKPISEFINKGSMKKFKFN